MSTPSDSCVSKEVTLKGHIFKDETYVKDQAVLMPLDSCVSKKVDLKRTYF